MNTEQTPDTLISRIRDLESQLARITAERDLYRSTMYDAVRNNEHDRPMTDQEIEAMLHAERGESFDAIVDRWQAELGQS